MALLAEAAATVAAEAVATGANATAKGTGKNGKGKGRGIPISTFAMGPDGVRRPTIRWIGGDDGHFGWARMLNGVGSHRPARGIFRGSAA
eukprot:5559305-Heterocapsa_arctica.AAC.1